MQVWICTSCAEPWRDEEVLIIRVDVRVIAVCKRDSSFEVVPICHDRVLAIHIGLRCNILLAVSVGNGIDGCIAEVASSGGFLDGGCVSFHLLPELGFILYLLLR